MRFPDHANTANRFAHSNRNHIMKITKLFVTAALLGSAAFATAQDKPKRPPHPPEVLEKFDTDKDGKLSKEEREAMRAEREKEMLEKYDADKDGKLSDEEKAVAKEDHKKEMLAKFDKDGDGKLSEEEREAMPKHPRGKRGPGGPDGEGPDGPPPGGPDGPPPGGPKED